MSASEKLKGIGRYGHSMGTFPHYAIAAGPGDHLPPDNMAAWEKYRDALPQIVAVVEAAEAIRGAAWLTHFGPGVKMAHPAEAAQFDAVSAALTALDEALS